MAEPQQPTLVSQPEGTADVTIEVGTQTIHVVASEATGEERERLFRTQAERFPQVAEYEQKIDRVIPVIVLTPGGRLSSP